MPDLKLNTTQEKLANIDITRVTMSGFVNASTFQRFQKTLETIIQSPPKELVLDFAEIEYINSTGMSTLVNYRNLFLKAGTEMMIVHTSDPVYGIMSLIGLPDIVPTFEEEYIMVAYIKSGPVGQRRSDQPVVDAQVIASTKARIKPQETKEISAIKSEDSCVLMVVPERDFFTEVTRMRLETPKGKFEFAYDCKEALELFDKLDPDLVILEDEMEGSEGFLSSIKVQLNKSITPIIKIYSEGADLNKRKPFKIWEDAYLVEPFEMMELFTLSEGELRQIPVSREILLGQTHCEFLCHSENVEKAKKLSRKILSVTGLTKDEQTELHAAFSEAVDNSILHGHAGNTDLKIDIVFLIDKEKVSITIEDEGKGFDFQHLLRRIRYSSDSSEKAPSQGGGKTGGLGIQLMSRCSDKLEFFGPGNCVRLIKFLNESKKTSQPH